MSTTSSSSSPEMSSSLITSFNAVPEPQLTTDLLHLCASSSWAKMVTQQRPYQNIPDLVQRATRAWYTLGHTAWQEAYAGHGSLGVKTAEQTQAVAAATTTTLASLQQANQVYEAKHGHKCITFAAGKDSKRLLHEVTSRTPLSVEEEMRRCAEQTMLITALRLVRYVHEGTGGGEIRPTDQEIGIVSPLTTHILDTSLGVPAEGVTIQMEQRVATDNGDEGWIPVATGATNSDGRVTDLLPGFYDSCRLFQKGVYRLTFDTEGYYNKLNMKCFYPNVVISFVVEDPTQHYHVPLLLNPYGYSTYRGS